MKEMRAQDPAEIIYRIVLEDSETPDPFIFDDQKTMLKREEFSNVPLLFGLVDLEGGCVDRRLSGIIS